MAQQGGYDSHRKYGRNVRCGVMIDDISSLACVLMRVKPLTLGHGHVDGDEYHVIIADDCLPKSQ